MTAHGWPRMMRRKTAASYLDMSEAAFEKEIAQGRLPDGVMFGGRVHWRKDAIDAAIARLTGEVDTPAYRRELQKRYGQAA